MRYDTGGSTTVCGMMNALGSFVASGVGDKGELIGQQTVADATQDLACIEPSAFPEIEIIAFKEGRLSIVGRPRQGKLLVVVHRERRFLSARLETGAWLCQRPAAAHPPGEVRRNFWACCDWSRTTPPRSGFSGHAFSPEIEAGKRNAEGEEDARFHGVSSSHSTRSFFTVSVS